MGALIQILTNSIGSLLLGITITAVGVGLMFYLIKSWHKNRQFTLLSYILGGIAFCFIAFHAIIICGAVTIKGYGNELETLVNSYVSDISNTVTFSQEDTQKVLDRLACDLPIVGYYASYADFSGHTPDDLASSMNGEMQRFMNKYIFRHLFWAFLFVLAGAFGIIKTMEVAKIKHKSNSRTKSRSHFYDE